MGHCIYIPKRYILVFLAHCGFFVVYSLRVNLSVAMVAMVNATFAHSESSVDPECRGGKNNTVHKTSKDGKFNWDQNDQGLILSSFFYGYLFTQIPGGWLGNKYGGKWVFAIGILVTTVFTLLSPIAASTNIYLFIVIRILEGLGEGVTFPAMHSMIAKWAPPSERSRTVIFSYSGATTGTIVSLPLCGLLMDSNFLGGWPSAFYVPGVLGIIWFVVWIYCVSNSPAEHPTISLEEKTYIIESQQDCSTTTRDIAVPWLKILSSIRVWAIIVAHFSNNWVWYLVLTGLPSYFKDVLNFNLSQNGFLSALPFLSAFGAYIASGIIADYLISRKHSITKVRRLMGIVAYYTAAVFLVLASFAGCDQIALSVTYMVLGTGFLCFNNSGFNVNHLDLAPRFGGVLMGLTNFAGTVAGCITPSITGYFTEHHPTRKQYRKVFLLAASVSVIGGTFYNIFVTGEKQDWNDLSQPQNAVGVDNPGEDVGVSGDENSGDSTSNM